MRSALLTALVVLAPVSPTGAQEVVTSFRGYPWGTTVSAIPELADRAPVGVKDELIIHSQEVGIAGTRALAGFYFHPRTGALVEGAYVFVLTMSNCHAVWDALVRQIEREYPTLTKEARIPTRTRAQQQVYESDCEYYAFNSHIETWTASYVNPMAPGDRILLSMRTVERAPRLSVVYRGGAGQAWATRVPTPQEDPPH